MGCARSGVSGGAGTRISRRARPYPTAHGTSVGSPGVLTSARLILVPLDAGALDALADGDQPRLEGATGARFGRPLGPPPLLAEHLDAYRAGLRLGQPEPAWRLWLLVTRDDGVAVGVAGLSGPVLAGAATLGWSVYQDHQGRGYATEALQALISYLLGDPRIELVRATIDPANGASRRVAEKAGMREIGLCRNPEGGSMVEVCARRHGERRGGRRGDGAGRGG